MTMILNPFMFAAGTFGSNVAASGSGSFSAASSAVLNGDLSAGAVGTFAGSGGVIVSAAVVAAGSGSAALAGDTPGGFRMLEDGTSFRLLEDATSKRILE